MQSPIVKLVGEVSSLSKRNIGVFAPCLQKVQDPIQQLFLDKIREYKSKTSGGKLVQASPEMEKELNNDKERVLRQYGFKSVEELNKFPTFNFKEPVLERPGIPKDTK